MRVIRYVDNGWQYAAIKIWAHTFEARDARTDALLRVHDPEAEAVRAWCEETFGSRWYANQSETRRRWMIRDGLIYFRDDTDAVAFKIRWG